MLAPADVFASVLIAVVSTAAMIAFLGQTFMQKLQP
jgi:hypothetical protein